MSTSTSLYAIGDRRYNLPDAPVLDWSTAPCHGKTDLFYAEDLMARTYAEKREALVRQREQEKQAIAICDTCTQRVACYETWKVLPPDWQRFGVWFGTTAAERERRTIRPEAL